MQAQQMADCLQRLAPMLDQGQAAVVLSLAKAIGPIGPKPFGAVAKKISKHVTAKGHGPAENPPSVLLSRMAEVSLAAGSVAISKDFTEAAVLLQALAGQQASDVFGLVADALAPPVKPPKVTKGAPVNTRALADKLTSEATNNERFDALVTDVSKLSKPVLEEIARQFLGFQRTYKNKAEVLKAIRARQVQNALDASRDRRINKIAV